jgi:hypothetical protein
VAYAFGRRHHPTTNADGFSGGLGLIKDIMVNSLRPAEDLALRKSAPNRRQPWTNDDDAKLRLWANIKSQREIAVALGRSISAVESRVRILRLNR